MRLMTPEYEISGKLITFAQSKLFPPEHNLPLEKKFTGTSSILARGKSRLQPTDPPFYTILNTQ